MYNIFISYSGDDDKNCDGNIEKFYEELNKRLNLLLEKSEVHVFFDKSSIQLSQEWNEEIKNELDKCNAFIYLQSKNYFSSEYCGKEWNYFFNRVKDNNEYTKLILPVLWVKVNEMPEILLKYQFTMEGFGKEYNEQGLYYIMEKPALVNERQEFVDKFAKIIIDRVSKIKLTKDSKGDITFENIKSPFHEKLFKAELRKNIPVQVKRATVLYVAGNRDEMGSIKENIEYYGEEGASDWKPFFPEEDREIGIITQNFISNEKFHYEMVSIDDIENKICTCLENYRIFIAIVDPWTVRIKNYEEIMKKCDKLGHYNFAVMIPYNINDAETKERFEELTEHTNYTVFASKYMSSTNYKHGIDSLEKFNKEIVSILARIKTQMIETINIKRKSNIIEGNSRYPSMPTL